MRVRRSLVTRILLCLTLLLATCAGLHTPRAARAQEYASTLQVYAPTGSVKISPDLLPRAGTAQTQRDADNATTQGVAERVGVIIQTQGRLSASLEDFIAQQGGRVLSRFGSFNATAVDLPADAVSSLADFPEVRYISKDRPARLLGHVSLTTGADAVRSQSGAGGSYTLDGSGVGIAVLDSSISHSHASLKDENGNSRVVADVDFTGEGIPAEDPYGHGTHVAALAAGNGSVAGGAYTGIAAGANIINLRVLDSGGLGTTSGLLAALDWVMNNRQQYNIRVVNMSLGTAAVDSYRNDPLCLAVRRLVDAGVVVVVAAGNEGKNAAGQKLYGMIHCPGNEPSAITVGAANTFGTDARDDDGVATYSSRGPTRSSWTDELGLKHYDGLMKPDLVAPGNKIIEAKAVNNLLAAQNPQLAANVSPVAVRDQMYLNGTSMASPVVAGAAALILQANPSLTPNMVKAILEYTAQPLANFNTLEQGAGEG